MFRPKFNVGPGHNVMEYRHQSLHRMAKRDVTTVNGEVVSIVFVTAEPTFTGVIGGYTTDGGDSSTGQTAQTVPSPAVASSSASVTSAASSPSAENAVASASAIPTGSASNPFSQYLTSSSAAQSTAAASNSVSFSSVSSTGGSTLASTGSADSSNSATSSSDAGMSTAGKAGLAIGVILAIGAVLGLILFLLSKKKKQIKQEQARQDSEKNAQTTALNNSPPTPATAPRLSFRPASSFMPEFMGRPKSRLSAGNMLGGPVNESNPMKEKYLNTPAAGQQSIQMTEKATPAENPFKDPENPFADPIRSAPLPQASSPASAPIAMPEPARALAPLPMPMPISAPAPAPSPLFIASPVPDTASDKIVVAAAGAGAVAASRAVMHHESPRKAPQPEPLAMPEPIEMPSPPVGVPAPLVMHKSHPSNASSAASAAPAPEGTVYRILMDFIPSMDDELELRAGQVVRMLHEYDDGWCLCTRLDRTQQGVVPRTCLAAKPSKPRPAPGQSPRPMSPAMGPPGPRGRPMSPAMRGPPPKGRPMSPGMGRPMSPAGGPQMRSMSPGPRNRGPPQPGMQPMSPGAYNQPPRPLSPGPRSSTQKRSMSPGPYGHAGRPAPMAQPRRRSNSSSQAARDVRDRRQTPPGPSPLGGAGLGMAI